LQSAAVLLTSLGPVSRLGFPSLCLQDGPLGIRFADHITAFPAGITTGATWNRDLFFRRGFAMGNEARGKGVNVLLGPAMGPLGMMPAGGRNWEGFSPDPVLSGVAAAQTIRGIQRNGVMATAKHYVMNEQEHFRQSFEWGLPNALSSNVDDRALREVFIWPFAESIRANVASVMCSYQMVNNSYACGNSKLLNGILKDELGFQGFVQSDWLAQRSGVTSALAGLDMSMPGDGLHWADGESLWGKQLTIAVLNETLPLERLNDMVTRIVAAWYQLRQDAWPQPPPLGDGGPNFSSWTGEEYGHLYEGSGDDATGLVNHFVDVQGKGKQAHSIVARQVAAEGTVLVKNVDNILPLPRGGLDIGRKYRVGIYGEDAGPGQGPNACPNRGCNQGTLASGWGSGAVDFPYLVNPWEALGSAWDSDDVETADYLTNDVEERDLVDKDLCIVFANADAGEGFQSSDGIYGDRNDLFLQKGGDRLVQTVADGCGDGVGETIVVIHAVGPVILESWIDHPGIKAVLLAHLPGEESGNALVDVLFGEVDASGRLPYTVGKSLDDYGETAQVLYRPNAEVPQVNFTDGLYIDYRYFDKHDITPRYEFGFGLSYTSFEFSNLTVTPVQEKSPLPSPRPKRAVDPPDYDEGRLDARWALFPPGLRPLQRYIYPYISDSSEILKGKFDYPNGYDEEQEPSPAGGGEGGNPSLYEEFVQTTVDVTNTGDRAGQAVVQVYVSFPDDVIDRDEDEEDEEDEGYEDRIEFPIRMLRNFTKVDLEPGESTNVELSLTRKDLSYWSVRKQNWVMPVDGRFQIWVGRSSRDLPLVGEY
jgi:beta-glucosidase